MKIVIIGAGEVGFQLAKGLSEEDFDITIIDIAKQKVQKASDNLDVITVQGDSASPDVLREAEVDRADVVVAVTRIDEVNLISAKLSHELGAKKIIANTLPMFSSGDRMIGHLIKNKVLNGYIVNPEFLNIQQNRNENFQTELDNIQNHQLCM